jgi:hypothetical protein
MDNYIVIFFTSEMNVKNLKNFGHQMPGPGSALGTSDFDKILKGQ